MLGLRKNIYSTHHFQVLILVLVSNIPENNSCDATYISSLKPSKSDEQDIRDTAGGVRTNSFETFSGGPHYRDQQVLDDQLELIYDTFVWTQYVVALYLEDIS